MGEECLPASVTNIQRRAVEGARMRPANLGDTFCLSRLIIAWRLCRDCQRNGFSYTLLRTMGGHPRRTATSIGGSSPGAALIIESRADGLIGALYVKEVKRERIAPVVPTDMCRDYPGVACARRRVCRPELC